MYEKIYHLLEKTGRVKTAMVISGTHKGRKCLIGQDGCRSFDGTESEDFWTEYEAELMNCQDTMVLHGKEDIFVEIYAKNPRLIILGGGHVSQPVAQICKMLGFHITVMDDREEFATRERFPEADCLITDSFEELSERIPEYENAYYKTSVFLSWDDRQQK